MTDEEIEKVEAIVKEKIEQDLEVQCSYMSFDKAKEKGAIALFGEKYGDEVRVVKTGDFTMELCGGTHVDHTSEIEDFFIIQETAIAAGMRRIEALTGRELKKYLQEQKDIITAFKAYMIRDVVKLSDEEISDIRNKISIIHRRLLKRENFTSDVSRFRDKIENYQKKQKKLSIKKLSNDAASIEPAVEFPDKKLLIYLVAADNTGDLMIFSDRFKESYRDFTIVTISDKNGSFVITSLDLASANEVFETMKTIGGARGGGKPIIRGAMAKDKIDDVIDGLKKEFG
jgi:alanyl-tRNA synthetase